MLTISRIRIASALVLSLFIHAGIMNLNSGWQQSDKRNVTVSRRVIMTLTARTPKTDEPPVEVIEEKAQPVMEQKEFRKIEKVVVQEIPRPVVVPRKKKTVIEPDTVIDKNTTEPVHELAVPQQQSESAPFADNIIEKSAAKLTADSITEENAFQEKAALLPVVLARPLYKKNPRPIYPSVARRRRYQGTTLLEVLVDSEGRVGELRVFQSCGHDILDRAALTAVKGWMFEPGKRGDNKVDMWVRVPIRFQLR